MTFAHIGGLPIEETLAGGGPALFTVLAAVSAAVRARLRRRSGEDERTPGSGRGQRTGDSAGDKDLPMFR